MVDEVQVSYGVPITKHRVRIPGTKVKECERCCVLTLRTTHGLCIPCAKKLELIARSVRWPLYD